MASLEFEISGTWRKDGQYQRWSGNITAPAPLVGIAFLNNGETTEWCRTSHHFKEDAKLNLNLWRDGERLHVNFQLAGAMLQRWINSPENSALPNVPQRISGSTAVRMPFVIISGDPSLALSFVLIAREDVRSKRTGLWEVRDQLSVEQPWLKDFQRGRTGDFSEPTPS